ncbi:TRAP transporter small permease [Sneathiella marina]|uniref:TRAP transporter small permease protein n=1 Tax=Sneathiella marina TaxID=2950108 RepID=A0ABY4W2Z8_9PROT|nr:TRAP transporter small permease [Sneathiella marina]USG61575.1 TRAP transporter small permease [Sneathiella marina]
MVASNKKIIPIMARMLEKFAAVILLLMVLHIVADVLLKFLFNYPLPGTLNIVANYYMVACVFLPIAIVELTRGNIAVDLFFKLLPKSIRFVLLITGTLFSLFFFALLGYQSIFDAVKSYNKGEFIDGIVIIQIWPSRFILPIGLGIAVFILVYRLIHELRNGEQELLPPSEEDVRGEV